MGEWRRVAVDPERLAGWLDRFADRHGDVVVAVGPEEVVLRAADGAQARCQVPFPPLPADPADPVDPVDPADPADPYGGLVAHALTPRRVGVLLVRLGGHAAGVVRGSELEASTVGSRPVHGRSAAGGWSQQRFARRRQGQVRVAHAAAADAAARLLVPQAAGLDAVVLGGDRRALESVLRDPRLAVLRPLVVAPVLDVADPRQRVLLAAIRQLRAVRIDVRDEAPGEGRSGTPV